MGIEFQVKKKLHFRFPTRIKITANRVDTAYENPVRGHYLQPFSNVEHGKVTDERQRVKD